jgi:protein-S-isoprenylcysteine O-methyltransferase Ste14
MAEWSRVARRIRVPLGFAFAVLYFWLARPTWRTLALGAVSIIPGLVIRALASGHVRKNEALATSGPYAYTRNPLYLGSLLVAMFFAIYVPVIRSEEAFLRERFPEFQEYANEVPRMIPRMTPAFRNEASAEFSMDLYLKHREYNALLGSLALVAALITKMKLLG